VRAGSKKPVMVLICVPPSCSASVRQSRAATARMRAARLTRRQDAGNRFSAGQAPAAAASCGPTPTGRLQGVPATPCRPRPSPPLRAASRSSPGRPGTVQIRAIWPWVRAAVSVWLGGGKWRAAARRRRLGRCRDVKGQVEAPGAGRSCDPRGHGIGGVAVGG